MDAVTRARAPSTSLRTGPRYTNLRNFMNTGTVEFIYVASAATAPTLPVNEA